MSSPAGLSLDQIFDWHRVHTPHTPYAVFSDEDDSKTVINWSSLGTSIHRCVQYIKENIIECTNKQPIEKPIVIGILANSDAITYLTMLHAHLHLTHPKDGRPIVPFLISPRNSPTVVAHLLKEVDVKYLWVTEGPMRDIAEEALKISGRDVQLLRFPTYKEIYETSDHNFVVPQESDSNPVSFDTPAFILHSSGSTAFPKPRVITHRVAAQHYRNTLDNGKSILRGERTAMHPLPVFHAFGCLITLWPAAFGVTLAVRSPHTALGPLSPESFLQSIVRDDCRTIVTVPNYLETWASDQKAVEILQKMKYIFWGGGPLSRGAGESLYKRNIPIVASYGATEFGVTSVFPEKPSAEGYEWFRLGKDTTPVFTPIEDEPGLFKLCFKQTNIFELTTVNTEIDGSPAYDSNDIVERHPVDPTLIRIVGRYDEQIMLSTGEKTNPVPLERIMERDENIASAVVFGRGRQSNGVLILPNPPQEPERLGVEGFRNKIWAAIEAANTYAPAHSRILKEMILLASPSKPFLFTDKRTVKRGLTLKLYEQEIEDIYKAFDESVKTDVPIPKGLYPNGGLTEEESLTFVRNVVKSILKQAKNIGDADDIFLLGSDSLQATFIKNTLLHALKQVAPLSNVRKLSTNFVYQFPTINGLAQYLAKVSRPNVFDDTSDPNVQREGQLDNLVHKYTQNWPVHKPQRIAKDEVVLLTGSTGGLGSQLLAQLVQLPSVTRIYAFNRKSSKSSYDRHMEVFKDRANDIDLLRSPKIVFVEGDTSIKGFEISAELFSEIQSTITAIIHNAWQVNFNITLASFEPAIRGVRNLIDLALSSPLTSPPTLLFTSTVDWLGVPSIPELPATDIDTINTSGYAESKWVSERILLTAEQQTTLKPVIIRVGQLSGGINGNWNMREWFPALIRGSQVVGGVPENRGFASFVPLHIAASTIIELRSAPIGLAHLVHPRPILWNDIIKHASKALELPVIPYEEWLNRLEKSPRTDLALKTNPALHLLDFYRAGIPPEGKKVADDGESMGIATYETSRTCSVTHSLDNAHLPALGKEEVDRWIGYWRVKGFLD
ncbi:putative NRPS-like protein biosynthetic cluster [Clathrus columnatus]|uniref:NRPS-like protein biosynthetic cluster n=1 Tax=Clathrus columnatus TaxID=1419009 RepID=A0AAV4ZWD1_9AGAM|nr:putative NRPS-like protein biosynthetic cluster [Clathrus columnatus]